jgi:hypothetical protein
MRGPAKPVFPNSVHPGFGRDDIVWTAFRALGNGVTVGVPE